MTVCLSLLSFFFFFNDTATTEIYTLSLHDALPIFTRLALRKPSRPVLVGQPQLREFLPQRFTLPDHPVKLAENLFHHAHGRFVQQTVGTLQVIPVSCRKARQDHIIKAVNLLRGSVGPGKLLEDLDVALGGSKAELQRRTQLVAPPSQRVGLLCKVPDVASEQDPDLHLWRRRDPASKRFHEQNLAEATCSDLLS